MGRRSGFFWLCLCAFGVLIGEDDAGLGPVSCASAGNCAAVGYYFDNSGNGHGLLLTETAGLWSNGVEAILPADATKEQYEVRRESPSGSGGAIPAYAASDDLVYTRAASRASSGAAGRTRIT